jgi:large subunit ribosomal protein L15
VVPIVGKTARRMTTMDVARACILSLRIQMTEGNKGQNSRSGGNSAPGFEGGQMPLYRRVARRGFSNYKFKQDYQAVSLDVLSTNFDDGETVNLDALKDKGIVKGFKTQAKILGDGDLTKKLVIDGIKVSATASEKIKAAGGEIR